MTSVRTLRVVALFAVGCGSSEPDATLVGMAAESGGSSPIGSQGSSQAGNSGGSTAVDDLGAAGSPTTPPLPTGGTGGAPGATMVSDGGATNAAGGAASGGASTGGTGGSSLPDPGTEGDGDFTISAPFTAAPEYTNRPEVPEGTMLDFTVDSTESAIFPGVSGPYTRDVFVYVPDGYVTGTAAPIMVAMDGTQYMGQILPVLDNLIFDQQLPRLIAIFIGHGGGDGPGSERGLEYDTVSPDWVTYVEELILPRAQTEFDLTFTTDPEGRATFGGSSGGTAAFTMGWFRPDLYRRILTYSGSFVNLGTTAEYPRGAWEYQEHLIAESDAAPLRIALEVGDMDNGSTAPATGFRNWVLGNQGMAAALAAKSYHYRFVFAEGAGHVDNGVIRQTMPETLLWLWRGYPIE